MYFPDKIYDILNWFRLIIPFVSTFYFTLSKLWGFDHVTEICGTMAAIAVLLESILKITNHNYNKAQENKNNVRL